MKRLFLSFMLLAACHNSLKSQSIDVPFPGDYADPTIVRVGEDFYMTHTSHTYFPGLLVWHSTDLKQWTPLTRALHQEVGTVWAPDITYHDGLFYIYFPTSNGGNYVVTAENPEGPWSDPVRIDVEGIDPGHAVSTDGKRYLYVNGGRFASLSEDGLRATSDERQVYHGWQYPDDWAVECFCLESPKLFHRDGYYYLVSAQGGTSGPSTGHMAVAARSKSLEGPWENSPYNPLVHTFDPYDEWVSKGHATLFDDASGNWYAVYHAYNRMERPQGRATLIEPVEWTRDGWPRLKSKGQKQENVVIYPNTRPQSDDFTSGTLGWQWCFWGVSSTDDYILKDGSLVLRADKDKLRALMAIASDADYEVTVELDTEGNVDVGLALMYNDAQYAGIGLKDGCIQGLWQGDDVWTKVEAPDCRYLRLKVQGYTISLSYSSDGKEWRGYPHGFDVSGFHTNIYQGFLSLKPAVLCQGEGNVVIRNVWFDYK